MNYILSPLMSYVQCTNLATLMAITTMYCFTIVPLQFQKASTQFSSISR